MKRFFAKLNRLFLFGADPSRMSLEWKELELQEYEKEQRIKDMVF
jgi:hypothetical protein